jgi:arginase
VGAAGREALALVTGRGQADLTGLEARTPVRDGDTVLLGIRANDEHAVEVRTAGIPVWAAREVIPNPAGVAHTVLTHLGRDQLDGWPP